MTLSGSAPSSHSTRLLIAEDEEKIAELIKIAAEAIGFDVITVSEGDLVLNKVASFNPDVIVLDLVMPGLDGIEVLRNLSSHKCTARIVLMSGMGHSTLTSVQNFATENKLDVVGLLHKPFKMNALEKLLASLVISRSPGTLTPESSVLGNLGLQLKLEPELGLTARGNTEIRRAAVCVSWVKDNGEILSHEQLIAAATEQESWRGLTVLFLREIAAAKHQWLTDGLDLGLVLPLPDGFLQDENLPDFLAEIFPIDSFKPGSITIEFSSRALEQNAVTASGLLPRLKFKGLNIAISCLAEDQSILKFIHDFPVDELTVDVDSSILSNSAAAKENEFQFSSLVSMALTRKIWPTVNGVSNNEQLEFAKRCGFTHARGPAVHQALLLHEVPEFFRKLS